MRKTKRRIVWLPVLILAVFLGYAGWALFRPLPDLKPANQLSNLRFSTPAASLSWPAAGESAVGVVGSGIIQANDTQAPLPTASTAKIITALTVLDAKPLAAGQSGPTITLGDKDISYYQNYAGQDGSVLPVTDGEQLSQYQMLQAMLLPSANNVADSLASWAFGSLDNYKVAAASFLIHHGVKNTTIGSDASGFSPTTTSTAHDLVILGELAMQNPVLAQIVGQSSASGFPIVDNIKNVNALLGDSGIIGIKTGNSNQDPGAYVSASSLNIGQKPVVIVTALLNAPSLFTAMKSSLPLIISAQNNFKSLTLLHDGAVVANYKTLTGQNVPVATNGDLAVTAWSGQPQTASLNLRPVPSNSAKGQLVGSLTVTDSTTGNQKSVPLKLADTPTKPNLWQRLTNPL